MKGLWRKISGFGRYPAYECLLFRPEKVKEVEGLVGKGECKSLIARGLGRAYGDAALNKGASVLLMERLDRMLKWDEDEKTLTCEAGVSLADIIRVFLPRGYFLPVTPGTKYCTVGGCFSCDVHGKNHHRHGSFGNFVKSIRLLLPSGEVVECSRSSNEELFYGAMGGMGLLGVVMEVTMTLLPVPSAYIVLDRVRTRDLDETLRTFKELDERYPYSVAWLDCLAKGRSFGRGVLLFGRHAEREELPKSLRQNPYSLPPQRAFKVPFDAPSWLLNPLSLWVFNRLYYAKNRTRDGLIVDLETYFYPLDAILDWNRVYGRSGFVQWQCVVPHEGGVQAILETLHQARIYPYLAVLKRLGGESGGLLSFPRPGYTVALDFPVRRGLFEGLERLDSIVLEAKGRIYLAKDARMKGEVFRALYPQAEAFIALKNRVDKGMRFRSDLARRLGLVGGEG